jgi:8-oxo-dGTP diphosphatase
MRYPRILRVADLIRTTEAELQSVAAALPRGVTMATAELAAGVLVTLEARRNWWDRRPRATVLNSLQKVMDRFRACDQVVVVAAALFSDGRVLAAQRGHPPALAGKWEFPGGKVEKGESPERALVRECAEELDVEVSVGAEIARERLDDGALLILFSARLVDPRAEPKALEHQELRWLAAGQVGSVAWLPANQNFSGDVIRRL